MDNTVVCGHRTLAEQEDVYNAGLSKVQAGRSKHNFYPSLAIDVAPYPIDWEDVNRFIYLAGIVKAIAASKNIPIRWGGDWNMDNLLQEKFKDWGHFEIMGKMYSERSW